MSGDTCRSCGAAVVFVTSAKSGKPMILDATPEKRVVLVRRGPMTTLEPYEEGAERVAQVLDVYVDHHATCPAAASWKGRTRKDPAP